MTSAILERFALGFPWQTADPFLFCVHHQDFYPHGNAQLGPAASLAGRQLGQDFTLKDGWRMYHGQQVPGFPGHPHRGFETITVVTRGFVDHADSLGAAGRYGEGDVQWMTAGNGVQHSEMFPLLQQDRDNPLELFQIWLNLPRKSKSAPPHFAMLWKEQIPVVIESDPQGHETRITLVAGAYQGHQPPAPPPDSWAADPEHAVAVWLIDLAPEARWQLPTAPAGVHRNLYCFAGGLQVEGQPLTAQQGLRLQPDQPLELFNGPQPSRLLLLQGQPIQEPVVQYGPFVVNSRADLEKTFQAYQQSQFGGWPWPSPEYVHPADKGRFARFPDGHEESPGTAPSPQQAQ